MDDPSDPANNPYAEGGISQSTPGSNNNNAAGRSNAIYFCHQCQADIRENDVLRTPELTCPQCRGNFLEKIDESLDDPHAFDAVPENPFAFFGGGPQQFAQGGGVPGVQGGPFAALLGQLFGGMGPPGQQGHQAPSSQSQQQQSNQPSQPGSAPGAASSTSSSRPGTAASIIRTPGGAAVIIRSGNIDSRPPSRQEAPSGASAAPQAAEHTSPDPPDQPLSPSQSQANAGVPIRNLASFLTEAFGGRSEEPRNSQQQQTSPLQEGAAQTANNDDRPSVETDDIFTSMLRALAGQAGVPIGTAPQQQQQQPQAPAAGNTQATPASAQGQQHGQNAAPGSGRPGVARVMFGNGNGEMTFSFVTGPGGEGQAGAQGMMPFPFPFLMGGAPGAEGGRMGDYVFSQGALDNIITELMNQASGRYGPQPAPQEMIDGLPTFKMTKELLASDTISDCAVCKDAFQEDEGVMKLPCNHLFHNDCIKPWLERSGTCPVCRHQLVEQPEPPRNPNIPATSGVPGQEGGDSMPTSDSAPVSPSVARSPPIEGGSRMPGGFPGLTSGFPFNLFGFGGASPSSQSAAQSSGTSGSTSNNRSQQEDNPQGQPDLDLDLD